MEHELTRAELDEIEHQARTANAHSFAIDIGTLNLVPSAARAGIAARELAEMIEVYLTYEHSNRLTAALARFRAATSGSEKKPTAETHDAPNIAMQYGMVRNLAAQVAELRSDVAAIADATNRIVLTIFQVIPSVAA